MKNPRGIGSLDFFGLHVTEQPRPQGTPRHIEGFHNLVKYLVRLQKDGTLDDDEFSKLVKRAAAASIKVEVGDRIERDLKLKIERVLRLRSEDKRAA
ncbi:hypothetical protein [Candidatus Thiosymbion oneisti]|uniref:hypothetical protein n=1 Tax=Candidatus Thiosymbion oneisti TaxID=589554 RepID=UPI001060D64A|nr:hypothetical protein [Candidatus Thiosymbion oneisti]